MRTNFRPSAFAIDCPSEVLPTPGGPTKQRIWPEISRRSFATARCSTMRSFTLSRSKWSLSSTARALSRSRLSSVERSRGSRRQPLEPSELPLGRLPHVLRQLCALEPLAELVHLRLLRVALPELR